MKISFYLHSSTNQHGQRPLMCRYSHSFGGSRPWRFPVKDEVGVSYSIHPDHWCNSVKDIKHRTDRAQRVRLTHRAARDINETLEQIEDEILEIYRALKKNYKPPLPKLVKEIYLKRHMQHDVLALFRDWAKQQYKGKSQSTRDHYMYAVRDITAYNEVEPVRFAVLDAEWGSEFLAWASVNVGNMSTASARLARFKAFIKWAYAKEYHKNTGFEAWSGKVSRPVKTSLTLEDLQAIRRLQGLSDSLESARDVLLWLCFSGMRHGEYYGLEGAVLAGDVLTYQRNKVREGEVKFNTLYLNHVLRELWEKYDGPPVRLSRYSLNKNFKTLGKLAGLVELVPTSDGMQMKYTQITTHTGRATLATLMDKYGAALGGVQRSLGHATRDMTERYIKSRDGLDAQRGFDDKIRELWGATG